MRPRHDSLPLQLKEIRDYKRNALTPGQPPKAEPEEESEEEEEEAEEEEEEEAEVSADEEEVQAPEQADLCHTSCLTLGHTGSLSAC